MMNLKNKRKKFFTLSRRHEAGFTLIELIVVIAILAILGGVAVPVYSGYVKKANMTADRTLVSEIENALMLAGYSGTFAEGEGGYILLSVNGVENADEITEGSALDTALDTAYGDGWRTSLKLKYSEWGSNGLYNNLTPETAYAVANSSYLTGLRADDLLSDVETMTNMAMNLVDVLGQDNGFTAGMSLSKMFTKEDGTCVIDATAAKYGVSKGSFATWEEWAADSEENNAAYSNLLVMTAADESEQYLGGVLGTGDAYEMSGASDMILEFSSFYAYAAINPAFSETLDKYMAHLNGTGTVEGLDPVTNASTGAAWYNSLKSAAGSGYEVYVGTAEDGQAFVDEVGFLSILGGIGNPSDEQAKQIASDLSNTNLFTDGIVNDMYNDYMDGVAAMNSVYDPEYDGYGEWTLGLGGGNVVILFGKNNGETTVANSLPGAK